jgi:hypothetical protein
MRRLIALCSPLIDRTRGRSKAITYQFGSHHARPPRAQRSNIKETPP